MSKESALAVMTGQTPVTTATPESNTIGTPLNSATSASPSLDSDRFAALARKEAAFVERQAKEKLEREAFLKEKDEVMKTHERAQLFEKTRKENPVEALKMIGFSETEIFNFLSAQEKKEATPEEVAKAVAEEVVESKLSARDKAAKEEADKAAQTRDNQLLGEFKTDLQTVLTANPDKYEFSSHYGPAALDLAYRTVLQVVQDSQGEDVPTAEEAIQMVEEMYEGEWEQMQKFKKTQAKAPQEPVKKEPERSRTVSTPTGNTPVKPPITKTRTLSNAATATTPGMARRVNETHSQKKERLIETIRLNGLRK